MAAANDAAAAAVAAGDDDDDAVVAVEAVPYDRACPAVPSTRPNVDLEPQ